MIYKRWEAAVRVVPEMLRAPLLALVDVEVDGLVAEPELFEDKDHFPRKIMFKPFSQGTIDEARTTRSEASL